MTAGRGLDDGVGCDAGSRRAPAPVPDGQRRIHILFVSDILYGTAGGAERVLSTVVRRLPKNRYQCAIATLASRPEDVDTHGFDCPVHRFPVPRLTDRRALSAAWGMARMIRSERISIVHTFFEASDFLGGLVAKLSGAALISSRRDMGFRRSRAQRIGYRLAGPLFDQVHAVAEPVRLWHIAQDGLDPAKVFTVWNGVDLQEVDGALARRPGEIAIPEGCPVVACVANVRPVKGIEHLARTAELVCREMPEVRFLVLGGLYGDDYLRGVVKLADTLGCREKILFAGQRSDVAAILKTCDVFYLPSLSEGLSNAVLEAMACGLPCLVTNVGGNPELVEDGRNGYLLPAGDARAAAGRVLELLRDPVRAAEMGRRGRAIVERQFSVEMMMTRLTALYERAAAGRAGNGR